MCQVSLNEHLTCRISARLQACVCFAPPAAAQRCRRAGRSAPSRCRSRVLIARRSSRWTSTRPCRRMTPVQSDKCCVDDAIEFPINRGNVARRGPGRLHHEDGLRVLQRRHRLPIHRHRLQRHRLPIQRHRLPIQRHRLPIHRGRSASGLGAVHKHRRKQPLIWSGASQSQTT